MPQKLNPELLDMMKKVNKTFSSDVLKMGVQKQELVRIPFSSPKLNYQSYGGGAALGRFTEIYGPNSSGKSTLCLDILASAQKMFPDRNTLYVDVETTYDPNWASNMGVDNSKIILMDCDGQCAEEILQTILELLPYGNFSCIIIDSIGAMYSFQASEKTLSEATYGGVSKAMTMFVSKCTPLLKKYQTALIGINQIRANIGNMYEPITTPGGEAWKFCQSFRFACRKGKFVDSNGKELSSNVENPKGHKIEVKMIKSKVAPSDRRIASTTLLYQGGLRTDLDIYDLAIKFEIIVKRGAWVYYTNDAGVELKYNGQPKIMEELRNNKELFEEVESKVNKLLLDSSVDEIINDTDENNNNQE